MILFSKALLSAAKKYVNYITQTVVYPPARIQIDSTADDYSKVYVSNVTTTVGYLRFYLESENLEFVCDSEYIYQFEGYANGYWQIRLQPTKEGIEIGNTYEIPCSLVETATGKIVQKFTIYYTRKV